ncbi:MAG: glycosyltransferase family 4 protein [Planctomycetota bacterium]|jgi:glycosyltransferase involved in cell wall biosynthesis
MSLTPVGALLFAGPLDRRGGPSLAWHTARMLHALGHRAGVVAAPGPLLEAAAEAGVPCYIAPLTYNGLLDFFLNRSLAQGLKREAYDLVHVQGLRWARAGARLAHALELPWVLAITEPPPPGARIPLTDRRLRALLATSQEIREDLVNTHRVPRDRIRVVAPGVDVRWFQGSPPFARIHERVPVCGLVSHLDGRAGVEVLIDAARTILHDENEEMHFIVAGDGPDARRLRRLAWRREVAHRFTFAPPETDYRLLLRSFDFLASPSFTEGLRLSVLEAMATSRPIVASAAGSIFSMVREEETGFVVPPGRPRELAKAILALVRDPARGIAMGEAGRQEVIEHWSLAERATELVDVYRRALAD